MRVQWAPGPLDPEVALWAPYHIAHRSPATHCGWLNNVLQNQVAYFENSNVRSKEQKNKQHSYTFTSIMKVFENRTNLLRITENVQMFLDGRFVVELGDVSFTSVS